MSRQTRGAPSPDRLEPKRITIALSELTARIKAEFPDAALCRVADALVKTSRKVQPRVDQSWTFFWIFWGAMTFAIIAAVCIVLLKLLLVDWHRILFEAERDVTHTAQILSYLVNWLILGSGIVFFVLSLHRRWMRGRVMGWLFKLRSFAHVIDMHQISKDPTSDFAPGVLEGRTESPLTRSQRVRYLHYCTELLSFISKLSALYAGVPFDSQIIAAANEMELFTSSMGRKIWQKIMILSQLDERAAGKA